MAENPASTGLIKLAETSWSSRQVPRIWGNTQSQGALFNQNPGISLQDQRSNPTKYQSDILQRIRSPFGIQNSMLEGRGSKFYGALNEANDWFNPLAYGSRAVEDVGHAVKNVGDTFRNVGHHLGEGNYGSAALNAAGGALQTGAYGAAAAGMGLVGYQMRHTPGTALRYGASATAGLARGGWQGAKNFGNFLFDGREPSQSMWGAARQGFTGTNDRMRAWGTSNNRFKRYLTGTSVEDISDYLNQGNKATPGKLTRAQDAAQKLYTNTGSPVIKERLNNLGDDSYRSLSKFRDAWKAAPSQASGARSLWKGRAAAFSRLPTKYKMLGALGAILPASMLSGAGKRDATAKQDIWNRWDRQDHGNGTGWGGLLASLPQMFGGSLGGTNQASNVQQWYR